MGQIDLLLEQLDRFTRADLPDARRGAVARAIVTTAREELATFPPLRYRVVLRELVTGRGFDTLRDRLAALQAGRPR